MKRGKKLQGNGMWESSRMMLPEHKAAIVQHRRQLGRAARPVLDEQRLAELSAVTAQALQTSAEVQITLYDPREPVIETGCMTDVDTIGRRIKLLTPDQRFVWVPMTDIVNIRLT